MDTLRLELGTSRLSDGCANLLRQVSIVLFAAPQRTWDSIYIPAYTRVVKQRPLPDSGQGWTRTNDVSSVVGLQPTAVATVPPAHINIVKSCTSKYCAPIALRDRHQPLPVYPNFPACMDLNHSYIPILKAPAGLEPVISTLRG